MHRLLTKSKRDSARPRSGVYDVIRNEACATLYEADATVCARDTSLCDT